MAQADHSKKITELEESTSIYSILFTFKLFAIITELSSGTNWKNLKNKFSDSFFGSYKAQLCISHLREDKGKVCHGYT